MHHTLNRLSLLVLGVLALLGTSCGSGSDDILERLPADAYLTVIVNGDKIAENAGCEIDNDGALDLSSQVRALLNFSDMPSDVKDIITSNSINRKAIALSCFPAMGNTQAVALVVGINDQDEFDKQMKNLDFTIRDQDGWKKYVNDYNDMVFGVHDGFAYICMEMGENPEDLRMATKFVDAAKEKSLADVNWKANQLNKGAALAICLDQACTPDFIKDQMEKYWSNFDSELAKSNSIVTFDLNGQTLSFEGQNFDSDGNEMPMPDNWTVNIFPEFIKYLNSDETVAAAVGISGSFPWSQIMNSLASSYYIPSRQRQQLAQVVDYLSMIDGTVAMGFGVKGTDLNVYDSYAITFAAQLKNGKNAEVASEIISALTQTNPDAVDVQRANDTYTVTISEPKYEYDPEEMDYRQTGATQYTGYISTPDDWLVLSTASPSQDGTSTMSADDFAGYGAIYGELPKSSPLMSQLGIPFGVKISMNCDGAQSHGQITLTETDRPFLQAILNLFK